MTRLPGLLADVVRDTFADDPAVRVEMLRATEPHRIDVAIRRKGADVIIVGVPAGDGTVDRGLPYDLALRHRDLIVLALSTDARAAWMYELRPSAHPIREVSPAGLRAVVHEALEARRGALP
jgi:hypothetical protein